MDLNYLKKVIKILDNSNLNELEIEEEGLKIRLNKGHMAVPAAQAVHATMPPHLPVHFETPVKTEETAKEEKPSEEEKMPSNVYEVKSPMVGTFYRAPSPDADPFVNVGDSVKQGSVLCIVEAMKLMNEIESEVSGKIVKILVENAQAVEYNQPLFLVEV
ncbi:MAG: acetyl-CoA carboxylase biotin carboxyl carrier protein [Ignavibacteriae bacterium]|nr:acetyl-CoA carboxylase biotin carboxyl carrier protein [Ignavibacteriota bacterium]MCB9242808.1 acetyl-CoA carboxylase biotin carboxyl carrier protein [Ignavibacteriales bacterium]